MAFIISNYLDINDLRAATENYDIYEAENFTTFTAGATLLGRDMREILKSEEEIRNEFIEILQQEVDKEDESALINQIMETHTGLKYEEVYNGLLSITNELSK